MRGGATAKWPKLLHMILVYDTETTGLPRDWNAPLTDGENWPRLVQLAWQLHTPEGKLVSQGQSGSCARTGLPFPFNAAKVHGITTERAEAEGVELDECAGGVRAGSWTERNT